MKVKLIIYLSISIFAVSLYLPAFTFRDVNVYNGLSALLIGWLGPLSLSIAWFANPLLALSWRSCINQNYSKGLLYSIASIIVALSFFLNDKLHEGTSGLHSFERGSGYYVWLACILVSIIGSLYGYYKKP
jgi:hypothetical protein